MAQFRAVTADQARQYDELGYFVLDGALGRSEVDALTEVIDPLEARLEEALREMEGGRFFIARAGEITFTTHLVAQADLLRRFACSPLLTDVCADLVGPDVRLYRTRRSTRSPAPRRPSPGTRTTAMRSSNRSST